MQLDAGHSGCSLLSEHCEHKGMAFWAYVRHRNMQHSGSDSPCICVVNHVLSETIPVYMIFATNCIHSSNCRALHGTLPAFPTLHRLGCDKCAHGRDVSCRVGSEVTSQAKRSPYRCLETLQLHPRSSFGIQDHDTTTITINSNNCRQPREAEDTRDFNLQGIYLQEAEPSHERHRKLRDSHALLA